MYYISRWAAGFAILALLAATWISILLARADANFRRGTPDSVARAVEITPRNTEYLAFRALQLEYDGLDSTPVLRRIASLAPLASAPRIRLGLAAEVRGDFDSAERWLLEAARIDRQFEPRWTLANYYFRRQRASEFWRWMHLALEVSYGDRRPAFDLCWRQSSNPQEILNSAIPNRHEVLAAYLTYLLETRHLPAAASTAVKLAAAGAPDDRPLLLAACDAFIEAKDGASALALWHAIGYPDSNGIAGRDFEPPRIGHGFDWRVPDVPGVSHTWLDTPPAHRIGLSGGQPESCELLRQFVTLQPSARYVLHWEARTQGLASPSGIEWRVADQRGPVSSSDDWRTGELIFTAPSELDGVTLAYQRPSGQPRAEGAVEVRHVSLVEVQPQRIKP